MSEIEMDVCKGCGTNFVYGESGSARISIKCYDPEDKLYFYEHDMLCPKCVNKITGEE